MAIQFKNVACTPEFRAAVREVAALRDIKSYEVCEELLPLLNQQIEKLRIQQKKTPNGR